MENKRQEEIQFVAKLAKSEKDKGYPLVFAHGIITIWSAVEALIDDLFVTWLLNKPGILKSESLTKIRISLARFETLDKTDRMYFLTEEIKREIGAKYKPGIMGFENLLKHLELSGKVERNIKRTLIEMKQVRNILVHRGGYIDYRAIQACPWTNWQQGQKIKITAEDYEKYFKAVCNYIFIVLNRVRKFFGKSLVGLPMKTSQKLSKSTKNHK